MMTILDWTKEKITDWKKFKGLQSYINALMHNSNRKYIIGEMLVIENLAALQIHLYGELEEEHEDRVENYARVIINDAIDNNPYAVGYLNAIGEILNIAQHLIAANHKFRNLKYYREVAKVFEYLLFIDPTLDNVLNNSHRLSLFNQLLICIVNKKDSLGITVPAHAMLYYNALPKLALQEAFPIANNNPNMTSTTPPYLPSQMVRLFTNGVLLPANTQPVVASDRATPNSQQSTKLNFKF